MIYVYANYQKPTPYIKRDIANVKVFTTPAGRQIAITLHVSQIGNEPRRRQVRTPTSVVAGGSGTTGQPPGDLNYPAVQVT